MIRTVISVAQVVGCRHIRIPFHRSCTSYSKRRLANTEQAGLDIRGVYPILASARKEWADVDVSSGWTHLSRQ